MPHSSIAQTDVLIVVDVQNDFLPGGSLVVPNGDAVIPPINAIARHFPHIVLTQDWHPPGHVSFASSHPGKVPFDSIELDDGRTQVLWPDHAVFGTRGADIAAGLDIPQAELVIRKGYRQGLDSYSAFLEADGKTRTGLASYLKERGFTRVFIAGLATDFCAGWTAIDAAKSGFAVTAVIDAMRGIDAHGSMERVLTDMRATGVAFVETGSLVP